MVGPSGECGRFVVLRVEKVACKQEPGNAINQFPLMVENCVKEYTSKPLYVAIQGLAVSNCDGIIIFNWPNIILENQSCSLLLFFL